MNTGDRRTRLKHMTADAHARLDARVEQRGFFSGEEGYRHYLQATWRARAATESVLDWNGVQHLYPIWPQRRLTALIRRDMQDVGLQVGEQQAPAAAAVGRAGGLLGALYVLEGSALGARIIGRRVVELGMTQDFGARHLNCQTSSNGAWAAFL